MDIDAVLICRGCGHKQKYYCTKTTCPKCGRRYKDKVGEGL